MVIFQKLKTDQDIKEKNSYHWTYCKMKTFTQAIRKDFITTCAGVGGGWRRIVNINISAGDDCPGEWRKATQSGVSFCRVASDDKYTCSTTGNISTNGISYQRVCGRARGYQKGHATGFYGVHFSRTIEEDYVSGLSITYSSYPRHHIWTYASGDYEKSSGVHSCPCTSSNGFAAPSFVGSNYYCESGAVNSPPGGSYFFNDALWDGVGCVDNCCNNTTQPWFYRQLNQITQDDIEARICTYGPFSSRSILIDQFELYIQ